MAHIIGQSRYQATLYPEVLDEVIAPDSAVRVTDAFVDSLFRRDDDGFFSSQLIVAPPSMTMVCPVMKVPALEARNTAAPAISSGSPMRNSGERAVEAFRVSGLSHN